MGVSGWGSVAGGVREAPASKQKTSKREGGVVNKGEPSERAAAAPGAGRRRRRRDRTHVLASIAAQISAAAASCPAPVGCRLAGVASSLRSEEERRRREEEEETEGVWVRV